MSSTSPYPMTNGETPLILPLMSKKPMLITNDVAKDWAKFWDVLLNELPTMYRNGETWNYPHFQMSRERGGAFCMAGTNEMVEKEFANLTAQGFEECDCSAVNAMNLFIHFQHPKLKKSLVKCSFKFKRWLGKEEKDEEGNDKEPKGYWLCPINWGLGAHTYGLTYVNVSFSIEAKTKDMTAMALDIANRKFMREAS